jgi:hypothetical protein
MVGIENVLQRLNLKKKRDSEISEKPDSIAVCGPNASTVTDSPNLTPKNYLSHKVRLSHVRPIKPASSTPDSATLAQGGTSPYTYQWQSADDSLFSVNLANIPSTNSAGYNPPAGLTTTTYYRRMVTDATAAVAYSNFIRVKVTPSTLSASVSSQTNVVCFGGTTGSATALVTGALSSQGLKVFSNPSGGNMPQGIGSAVIGASSMFGKLNADVAVTVRIVKNVMVMVP